MDREDIGIIAFVLIFLLFILGTFALAIKPTAFEKSTKLDTCIKYVNATIPNANDTEERSKALKECYEND